MKKDHKLISKKKPTFPIIESLKDYLDEYNRTIDIPISYDDLTRFSGYINVLDKKEQDTLWIRVYYSEFERESIDFSLKKLYTILLSDGKESTIKYLNVDAVDFCTFGNSKPFRIKIRNILNDNFTYFYIKKTDASRVYGLELEHMLSPYNLNFLVCNDTLVEEHISGIPGDIFLKENLDSCTESEKSEIAKEFVKFNERCLIRLLGDMRSYNYVIVPTHDFDHVAFKIRAIDFDQQCYEGNINVYRPSAMKENKIFVKLVESKLQPTSINQYRVEERSMITKRIYSFRERLVKLIRCMKKDTISTPESIASLKTSIYKIAPDLNFKRSKSMGDIMTATLDYIRRNYEDSYLHKS